MFLDTNIIIDYLKEDRRKDLESILVNLTAILNKKFLLTLDNEDFGNIDKLKLYKV